MEPAGIALLLEAARRLAAAGPPPVDAAAAGDKRPAPLPAPQEAKRSRHNYIPVYAEVMPVLRQGHGERAMQRVLEMVTDPLARNNCIQSIRKKMLGDETFYDPQWATGVEAMLEGLPDDHPDIGRIKAVMAVPPRHRLDSWKGLCKKMADPMLAEKMQRIHPMTEAYRKFYTPPDAHAECRAATKNIVGAKLSNQHVAPEKAVCTMVQRAYQFLVALPGMHQTWRDTYEGKPHVARRDNGVQFLRALIFKTRVALQLLTGRRPTGLYRIRWRPHDTNPLLMWVSGLCKKRDKDEEHLIPLLAPSDVVMQGVEFLRTRGGDDEDDDDENKAARSSPEVTKHAKQLLLQGVSVKGKFKVDDGEELDPICDMGYATLRGLYARAAYLKRGENKFLADEGARPEESYFVKKALCHQDAVSQSDAYKKVASIS